MQFELTKDYLASLKEAIESSNKEFLEAELAKLHAADIAEILDELSTKKAKHLFELIEEEKSADVLVELEDDVREEILKVLSSEEIADQVIDNIDSDDAADVIAELPDDIQVQVIAKIEEEDPEQASDIVDLLNYDEDTAGGLMAKEMVVVNQSWTITNCLREMRKQAEELDDVYAVYVVDDDYKLKGLLSLSKMLVAPARTMIADIYDEEVHYVTTDEDEEEVANIMDKYDLVVLPVVNEDRVLQGRITIDDVVDVIKEEAEKDYQMASGITEDVESSDKIWILSRARLPWLLIGLVGGVFVAQVIGMYEEDIQIYPEMAFFIPLIAAMGGNVGVQSSALIVQGLANNTLGMENMTTKLLKEFGVALINGVICSVLILGYNVFFSDSMALSITVSVALLSVIIIAGLFGTLVPLLLNRYKIDPALATGPFITTLNDIFGLIVYFIIGRYMYLNF
ncbi:MAG: magnesium transporter [Flavobacteriales bacterium]|nr:magnesium transporter [Flavobacteriales bacterium]